MRFGMPPAPPADDPVPAPPARRRGGVTRLLRPLGRFTQPLRWFALRVLGLMAALVVLYWMVNPPTTWTIMREAGPGPRAWVRMDDIAPVVARSVVAAEDANFCNHWGFDMTEIRRVVASGSNRGASTITQQTAKNVYLWQGRSWARKLLETVYTPMIEAVWSKRRILEAYLNVAEFGPGIFGIDAAARELFGTTPDKLTARQAAALAAVLPAPKTRSPDPGSRRARAIADGAATIDADGRAACFQRDVPAG